MNAFILFQLLMVQLGWSPSIYIKTRARVSLSSRLLKWQSEKKFLKIMFCFILRNLVFLLHVVLNNDSKIWVRITSRYFFVHFGYFLGSTQLILCRMGIIETVLWDNLRIIENRLIFELVKVSFSWVKSVSCRFNNGQLLHQASFFVEKMI